MRFPRSLLVLVAAIAVTPRVYGADDARVFAGFTNTSWTAKDGLASAFITAITQDKDGYLWLGSSSGPVRFDGVRFVSWSALGGPRLRESSVLALRVSRDGSLWIGFGNLGGVSRFQNGALSSYTSQDGLPDGSIRTLLEDREGTLWAGGFNGLARFSKGRWERMEKPHGLPEAKTVDRLYEDPSGNLWVVTSGGVLRRNPQLDMFEQTESGSYRARDVIDDIGGAIWITGQPQAFRRLQSADSSATPQGWGAIYGHRLLRDRQGKLWVATLGQGLLHVPNPIWSNDPVVQRLTREKGLTSDWVTSLYEDREGNIWVGTDTGLSRLTPSSANPVVTSLEFAGQTVRTVMATEDDSLWTGTGDGLHRLWHGRSQWYREHNGLPGATIRALHSDTSATLWVATSRGPARFADGRFSLLALPTGIRLDRIDAMTTDTQGNLWLCDFSGIYRWKDGALTELKLESGTVRRTPPSVAYTDSQGRVWIGFTGGGLVMHQNGALNQYFATEGLNDGAVRVIYEDTAGTIWVGTLDGLSKFANGRFVSLAHSGGLAVNRVTAIVEDEQGYLWLGTDAGLVRVKRDEFDKAASDSSYPIQYRLLDASDGLEGVPTSQGQPTSTRSSNGMLWFVTGSGLAAVDPRALRESLPPAAPVIERILTDERAFVPGPQLRLPARTARLQFDYTSLTFAAPARVLFRYRLEGYDTDWIDAGSRRQAFYTNLPPRSYKFRVAARRNDSAWVESGGGWEFSIAPAFYRTNWFYAVCVVLPALALWGAWRLRMRHVREKFSVVLAERVRLAHEIHDTLLQGMLGVALQLHSVSETLDSSQSATKERCERARDNLEHYIHETRLSIWDLHSSTRTRHDLATALRDAADNIAATSAVGVSLQVSGRPRPCGRLIEEHILRIGQEAVRNVVRHAQATHVRVHLCYDERSVLLRISDDGRGFDPGNAAHTAGAHWGLRSMRERAEQIGGRLSLTSSPGGGTEIEAIIPLSED